LPDTEIEPENIKSFHALNAWIEKHKTNG